MHRDTTHSRALTLPVLAAFLLLALPGLAAAEVVTIHTPADSPSALAERAARLAAVAPAAPLAERETDPEDRLILPYYFVDPSTNDTALFAVRNTSALSVGITISYYGLDYFDLQQVQQRILSPKEVHTVNIRDVAGLTPQLDGTYRGFVVIESDNSASILSGDYFQVDLSDNFATGDQLAREDDYCATAEVRFLQGGPIDGGTQLAIFLDFARGGDPDTAPPSAVVDAYDEAGNFLGMTDIYADENVVFLPASSLSFGEQFGALEINFNGSTGLVQVTYDADGKYSIGMVGTCLIP